MLLLGAGLADQESPGVSRGDFLKESHLCEESLGAGPNQHVFSGAQRKLGKKKDANIPGMCPAVFCVSTLEYNRNVTKKDSTE